MLTIHTPVELKNNPSILTVSNDFPARISANYQQIGTDLQSGDLLHLITAPPEIYLGESGEHSLVDITNSYHIREVKLNLINNVLNRVLAADNYGMTYQDQVFITNILKKLGVTDVKEFMRQVQILKQEADSRNRLTDIYWDYQEELTSLTRQYEQKKIRQERSEAGDEPQKAAETPALWLYQEIIDRLQTGVVYQELRNYLSRQTGDTSYLTRQEMQISEQSVMAEHILLNQLKNRTTVESTPLIYNHINRYELGDAQTMVYGGDHTVNEMIQAVLLRAVDQIYSLRYDELHRNKNVWYELANAVYETAGNTIERFENYHNRTKLSQKDIQEYQTQVQVHQQNEITALQHLLKIRKLQDTVHQAGMSRTDLQMLNRKEDEAEDDEEDEADVSGDLSIYHEREIRYRQQIQDIRSIKEGNDILSPQLLQAWHQSEEHTQQVERIRERRETQNTVVSETGVQPEETKLQYVAEETAKEAETSQIYEDARMTNENYIGLQKELQEINNLRQGDELLHQQINQISQMNQQNIESEERTEQLGGQINLQHLTKEQVTKEDVQKLQTSEVHRDQERIRTENAQKLEQHQSKEHTEQIERIRERRETQNTVVSETGVRPEETKLQYGTEETAKEAETSQIYEDARMTNENYIRHQNELREINNLRQGDELLLQQIEKISQISQQNIERQERIEQPGGKMNLQQHVHIDRTKAMEDVWRAVEHPQEVLSEYMNTQTPAELQEQENRNILREIYDENTIRILDTIEQYRKEPEILLEKGIVSDDPLGQLQRDINLQYLTKEQVTKEDVQKLQTLEVHYDPERIRTENAQKPEQHQSKEHTEQIERIRERRETQNTVVSETGVRPEETKLQYGTEETAKEAETSQIYEDARMTNENYIRHQNELQEINNLRQGDELLRQQIEQISQINQQNIERQERIEQLGGQMNLQQHVHIDRTKAMADVLRAIEHPQEVLLEYMNTQTPAELQGQKNRNILREIYDENTIRIFETIEQYRKEPEILLEKGIVSGDPFGQLQRDINLQYLTNEQMTEDVQKLQTLEVHHDLERIRTENARKPEKEALRKELYQHSVEAVELYHRENETAIDEELLEELRTVNKQTMQTRTQVQNVVNEHYVIEEKITNRVNELKLHNEQELAEMVSRNVRQQLRGMSERVYQKLEKRMDTERRRRGL